MRHLRDYSNVVSIFLSYFFEKAVDSFLLVCIIKIEHMNDCSYDTTKKETNYWGITRKEVNYEEEL